MVKVQKWFIEEIFLHIFCMEEWQSYQKANDGIAKADELRQIVVLLYFTKKSRKAIFKKTNQKFKFLMSEMIDQNVFKKNKYALFF